MDVKRAKDLKTFDKLSLSCTLGNLTSGMAEKSSYAEGSLSEIGRREVFTYLHISTDNNRYQKRISNNASCDLILVSLIGQLPFSFALVKTFQHSVLALKSSGQPVSPAHVAYINISHGIQLALLLKLKAHHAKAKSVHPQAHMLGSKQRWQAI